jgi:hypothetical protein
MGFDLNPPGCRECGTALKPVVMFWFPGYLMTDQIRAIFLCVEHGTFYGFRENDAWVIPQHSEVRQGRIKLGPKAELLSPADVFKRKWLR